MKWGKPGKAVPINRNRHAVDATSLPVMEALLPALGPFLLITNVSPVPVFEGLTHSDNFKTL